MNDPGVRNPLAVAAERVGDRWSLLLVEALLGGPRRFSDLEAAVPGIAPNILSRRLAHLEAEAVVVAVPYSERPKRYAYELTASGRELAGALRLLAHWAGDEAAAIRHAACGTAAEPRWYCPTCARTVDDGDLDDLHWV
jgi:DNA-binding HxlR family transcriptional regulator